jgi:hypothetical protein
VSILIKQDDLRSEVNTLLYGPLRYTFEQGQLRSLLLNSVSSGLYS